MGDAEDNLQPSKKRAAGVQLSRENPGLDENEDSSEQESGTFKRASDEVLATRKIVKVRRKQTSAENPAATSPANPFAAIRLVPPVDKETEKVDNDTSNAENKVTEAKDESTFKEKTDDDGDNARQSEDKVTKAKDEPNIGEKTDGNGDNFKQSESKVDESKAQLNPQNDEPDDATKQNKTESVGVKVSEGENTGDDAKTNLDADNHVTGTEKDVENKGNNDEKDNGDATSEKNTETVSFSSFQQLSSGQNAFSGFSGTSFSFGSIPKDGSSTNTLFAFGGSSNGNSSIFGSYEATSVFSKSESSKFPPPQEVSVETGEENEKAVFTADSVLFEYIDGAWKERGKGELKVNVSTTETAKARLIMRARGNYRLILNASLFPDMKLTNMDKKGITLACVNSASEGKEGLSTIALKFKDASIVADFRAAVMEHKDKMPVASKTPENLPKASDE